jgi:hypothetical protein
MRFGFRIEEWERLAEALVEHARENELAEQEGILYGVRYALETVRCGRPPDAHRRYARCGSRNRAQRGRGWSPPLTPDRQGGEYLR